MCEAINLETAAKVASKIIEEAKKQEGEPIAVTIMASNFQSIVMLAMDGVMPLSINLSRRKAYTALVTERDTVYWEEKGVDPSNLGSPEVITCFGGGVLLKDSKLKTAQVIGAVGVSGRKSKKSKEDKQPQDHELAIYGKNMLIRLLEEAKDS